MYKYIKHIIPQKKCHKVATIDRFLKFLDLFCKRGLQKKKAAFAEATWHFREPTKSLSSQMSAKAAFFFCRPLLQKRSKNFCGQIVVISQQLFGGMNVFGVFIHFLGLSFKRDLAVQGICQSVPLINCFFDGIDMFEVCIHFYRRAYRCMHSYIHTYIY